MGWKLSRNSHRDDLLVLLEVRRGGRNGYSQGVGSRAQHKKCMMVGINHSNQMFFK
jgi:hypothetical protein